MNTENHIYDVNLVWNKGRTGTLSSSELNSEIEVATPPGFPGGVEGIWSPEHLFVGSITSCFMTTFLAIAEFSNLEFESFEVAATGTLGKPEGKIEITEVVLKPKLTISDEKFLDKAERILQKAKNACLISRSVKSTTKLEPEIVAGVLGETV